MDTEIKGSESLESAVLRAQARMVNMREKATVLQAEFRDAIAAHGVLVVRAAAGEDVPEQEWDASEVKTERLGRLADRYVAILNLQANAIEAGKAAVAGEVQ